MNKHKVIPLMGIPGTQLSEYTVKDHLTNSDIQCRTLEKLYNKFKPDGLFTFMDLTVEAEALGLKINFPENDTPSVIDHSIKNKELLHEIINNYQGISARMKVFIDVVKKLKQKVNTSIGAYVIGPFSLAGEMNGVNDLLLNTMMDPEFVKEMVDFSVDLISDYANKLFEAGADSVCILEPTAMMLYGELYELYSLQPFQKIFKKVDHKPLILHICGDTSHLVDGMCKSGASGLSLDSMVDFKEVIKRMPAEMELIGNLDPVEVFLNAGKEEVKAKTEKLMEEMKNYPNFVLSSGCDLPMATPLENVEAFMKAGKGK